jgi:hypothetical protein
MNYQQGFCHIKGEDMEINLHELILQKSIQNQIEVVTHCNDDTAGFGLTLTKEDAKELILCKNESLKRYRRVEFGKGMLDKLIYFFCDSSYIHQDNYLEVLEQLEDVFYEFKNESMDQVSDDELLTFMREQFDDVCFGSIEYLESTCLDRFAMSIKKGYRGYQQSGGSGDYERLREEPGWDRNLYETALKDQF